MADSGAVIEAGWRRGARAVWLLWLVLAAALLAFSWPAIVALKATDADDYMRLLEVRDWLAGQGWGDVHQYRMDPPHGADMHWSRLIDLPIAAVLALARLAWNEPAASAVAMAVVPLVQLLVAMLLLHRLMRTLATSENAALAAAAIVLLFPMLTSNFMPMRIDHHGWQAVCALGCMVALQGRRGPLAAGVIAGIWLTISLEGLVLALALAGILALRWLRTRENALAPFCLALAASGTVLGLALRGTGLAQPTVDQFSWPHLLAFAVAGGVASGLRHMPGQGQPAGRLAALALIALAGGAAILWGLGRAAIDPFSGLDPVVRHIWLEQVPEGLPIGHQDWSTRAMLVWTPLLVVAAWKLVPDSRREAWGELAILALVAGGLSLLVMRISVSAQLLTVPFSALLLARWFPWAAARRSAAARVPAMLACLLALTPSLASAAGKWLDNAAWGRPVQFRSTALNAPRPMVRGTCAAGRLGVLPKARLFALLDLGPEILVRTGHSVVAGSYHRNGAKMREVIEAFSGDPTRAREIVRRNRADYLVFCTSDDEARIYAGRRADGLAAALMAGRHPDWLVPVRGFDGALQVFEVR